MIQFYFMPSENQFLYKAQIRPCLEYGSLLWRRASKYSLATLNTIQNWAIRLIDASAPTDSLGSLAHRRNVSALSLYYRYYHGGWYDELNSLIPPKAWFARSTRFADSQHSFAVILEKCQITSFANTFVPMTSRNWLPASIFPSTYNLQTFKNPRAQTPMPPPSHLNNFSFSSVMQGSFEIHRGCIILVRPFLHSISLKKKSILLVSCPRLVSILLLSDQERRASLVKCNVGFHLNYFTPYFEESSINVLSLKAPSRFVNSLICAQVLKIHKIKN